MSVAAPPRLERVERVVPTRLGRTLRRHRALPLIAAGIVGGAFAVEQKAIARAIVAFTGILLFAVIAQSNRRLALGLIVTWLVFLGFVRRLLIPFAGWSPQDPMLLVSPACAFILWFLGSRERTPRHTFLSGIGLFLLLMSAAQIVNPQGPSLLVSAQAALFWITPFLWFFVGRLLTSDEHEHVLKTVLILGVVVTGYGFYHTFVGLLPFEYTWVGVSGFGASIFLPGFRVRPFSTLVSPQEYGYYLVYALVFAWAWILHRRPGWGWLLPYLGAAAVALFLQGSRQILGFFLLGFLLMTALRARSRGAVLVVSAATAFAVVFFASAPDPVAPADPTKEANEGRSTASIAAQHQAAGFTNPGQSTAPLHVQLILEGFTVGIENPFGVGIGTDSLAAAKVAPDGPSPENDVANVVQALGVFGGVLYAVFIVAGLVAASRAYRRDPSWLRLAWFGLLAAAITQWWSGTMYAVSTILFLSLGALSRPAEELEAEG